MLNLLLEATDASREDSREDSLQSNDLYMRRPTINHMDRMRTHLRSHVNGETATVHTASLEDSLLTAVSSFLFLSTRVTSLVSRGPQHS